MKHRFELLIDMLVYLSIYPLLISAIIFTIVAFNLASRLVDPATISAPARQWPRVELPPVPIAPTPVPAFANSAGELSSISRAVQQRIPPPDDDPTSGDTGRKYGFTVLKASFVKQSGSSVVLPTSTYALRNFAKTSDLPLDQLRISGINNPTYTCNGRFKFFDYIHFCST